MTTIKELLQRFQFPVYLAPMEGVTDRGFRCICKEYGADVVITEFISSDALSREVEKSIRKMEFLEDERPFGVQIFGSHEDALVAAAKFAAAHARKASIGRAALTLEQTYRGERQRSPSVTVRG